MVRFPWLRDAVRQKQVKVKKIHAKLNMANFLTKSTSSHAIHNCMLGMGYVARATLPRLRRIVKGYWVLFLTATLLANQVRNTF